MAARTLKVTVKTVGYRRNTTRSSFPATLFALAGLAAMLFSVPLLFINISRDGAGADSLHSPANVSSSLPIPAVASPSEGAPSTNTTAKVHEAYGQMPMSFEANRGQADQSVNFVARGAGYTLALSPTAATFALSRPSAESSPGGESSPESLDDRGAARRERRARRETRAPDADRSQPRQTLLRMNLVGANGAATVAGQNELEGKVNYFLGNDPAKWRTDVPTFGRVRYAEVYPGIDVVYYGNQKRLEYDFVIAPGRDAGAIALEFAGAQKVEVDGATGDLLVRVGEETIRQHKPITYQETDTGRREVESRYTVGDGGRVGFEVGEYDRSAPLVIDPVLQYSTYLGGSTNEFGYSIALDSSGNAYLTGATTSTNFPTANPIDGMASGTFDGFVTKINAAGTALVYSTYLGGSGVDSSEDIAVDSAGNAYLTGWTNSTNFPTASPIDSTHNGSTDVFVTKINAAGTALVYSTFLGGSIGDGDVTSDAPYELGSDIVVDSAGNAYATGTTDSTNFPTANPIQGTKSGTAEDAYITKINAAGTALVYSTYLGGTSRDSGFAIALDSSGNAYLTGWTNSTNFPTANPIDGMANGDFDDFVTKINAAGTALVYSTFLGGSDEDFGDSIAVDSAGNAYVTGGTTSANFPTVNPIQGTHGGSYDAYVTKINPEGSGLIYSTYLGRSGAEVGYAVAVDSAGNAYLTGQTTSTCFPTTTGAFDTTYSGGENDAFISKISETAPPSTLTSCATSATVQFSSATFNVTEGCVPATLTVTLTGTPTGTVAVDYTVLEGTAKQKTDFTYVAGTLLPESSAASRKDAVSIRRNSLSDSFISGSLVFAAGETSKEITVLITEDGFAEGTENLSATLSNPRNAGLGSPTTTTLNINDNDTVNSTMNPIDDAPTYVCQLYHDFLHRQADTAGQAFWANEITQCGANQACVSERRHNVAAAFFLSVEFQQTGYFVYRAFESGLDRRPQYEEFMQGLNAIGLGVEVGIGDWQQRLEAQRRAFAEALVERTDFKALFPDGMTAEQFADKLFANANATPTTAERNAVISAFGAGNTTGRAAALIAGLETGTVYNQLYNPGFVLIEYFGFMRRDPEDPPDTNLDGFNFWLDKMDDHTLPGEDARLEADAFARIKRAEMVRAFIIAGEYRGRFGP